MDINNTMEQNISTLFTNIESFTQDEGTLGKPVALGDKTLIPVISVTIGYGGGNSSGKMSSNNTNTTQGSANTGMDALGLGAKICTDAVVVVDGNNLSYLSLNNNASSSVNQLINKIPQMMGMGQNTQQQGQQNQSSQSGSQS